MYKALRLGFWLTVLCVAVPGSSSAQSRSIDAHFFRPALYTGGIFGVDRAARPLKWQPGFKFFFNHANTPLRLTFPQQNCTTNCIGEQDILTSAQVFNFQAQMSFTRWLELAVDLPLVRQSYNTNPDPAANEGMELLTAGDALSHIGAPDVSLLDMRVGLRANLYNGHGLGLALDLQGTLPFGDEEYFAGDRDFTFHPGIIASYDRGFFGMSVNAGYRLRKETTILWDDPDTEEEEIPVLSVDDELTFGLGLTFRLHRIVALGAEVLGSVPMVAAGKYDVVTSRTTTYPDPPALPTEVVETQQRDKPGSSVILEALGGAIFTVKPGLDIAVGAGAGALGDERRVAFRVFGGVSWMPGMAPEKGPVTDRDLDGVPDDKDACPDQPEDKDGYEDDDGCPELDNDGDGVEDGADKCPNEAEDRDGFEDDDGCIDRDNDKDGIPDTVDKCPDSAEDKDNFQDDDGCPEDDNDGDGIADAKDRCPNEPETKNNYQDDDGCPDNAPGVQVGKGKLELPERVRFKKGKAELNPASNKLLDDIAKKIIENPQVGQIRIEGHTDNTGRARTNQRLSERRANTVRQYLISKGVNPQRLTTVGYGASRPIADNKTAEGRATNRRVEFIIIQQQGQK